MLQKMGWRPGKGVGHASSKQLPTSASGSKWGTVSGVSLENTPLYVLVPKVGPVLLFVLVPKVGHVLLIVLVPKVGPELLFVLGGIPRERSPLSIIVI